MAPIRRYLRITKYSVLEVRIYPEKPSDTPWLLSTRDPVLSRVIEEVRPKVLPKLREENENAKKKGGKKKKGIRDVASQEDFEVVMFLTEGLTRHSLITKQKQFTKKPKIQSTGNKLTGWLNNSENPITLEDNDDAPEGLREELEDETALGDIPELTENGKRKKDDKLEDDDDPLFVSSDDDGTFQTQRVAPSKRRKGTKRQGNRVDRDEEVAAEADVGDDKKKLGLNTTYDGFSIYGRILCLIVKRKGKKAAQSALGAPVGGSQMMEHWVSTQVAQEAGLQDDDEG
ncbi:hypothetical protein MBLNU13_g09953t1 [Cladosporium sp. NU13]